ncbi:MAG: hypothetical protein WDZ66_00825 [Steroidobacteraceae bacterium]
MPDASDLLIPAFPVKHIKAALTHFTNAVNDYGHGHWEDSIAKTGKFVEAILKAVATHCGIPFESGRKFKADKVMNALAQLADGSYDDSLRLLIPRACRAIYDIASNRGARHDPDEIDPNIMDANVVMPVTAWILAEAIRYAQKGAVDPSRARELVESLVERKYPVVEDVEGRVYFHARKKSAVDVGLVLLARRYPKRVSRENLVEAIRRNGFTLKNSRVAAGRIEKVVDDDGNGQLRLLAPGLKRAEAIIFDALKASS